MNKRVLVSSKQFRISGVIAIAAVLLVTGIYFILHTHAATCSSPPGDANCDTVVNVLDLSILATNWGKTSATWSMGDFNGDAVVNIIDLSLMASHWNQTGGSFPFATSVSSNRHYLLDQSGNPFMVVGDSPQSLIGNLSESEADTYFADRQSLGINTTWINLLCDSYTGCNSDGTTFDGIKPFNTPGDVSTPNPVYFQRVDDILNLAAKHGITVFLDPAETGGWLSVLDSNGVTKDKAYGQYLGNRYKNFPNIVWQSGNDFQSWSNATDDAAALAVINGIKAAGDTHLNTVELNYNLSLSTDDPNWAALVDLNAAYTYYPTYDQVLNGYNHSPAKPTFMVEAHYDFENVGPGGFGSPLVLRRQEYWTMTSGGTGQHYGSHYTWNDGTNWTDEQAHLDSPGAIQLGYMTTFFKALPWWNLIPDQNHSLVTAGFGTYDAGGATATNDYVTAALTADGTTGVVYVSTTHTITVNLAKVSGTITAKWYDPTTNTYTTIGSFPNTGTHQFTSPAAHSDGADDWILLLQS